MSHFSRPQVPPAAIHVLTLRVRRPDFVHLIRNKPDGEVPPGCPEDSNVDGRGCNPRSVQEILPTPAGSHKAGENGDATSHLITLCQRSPTAMAGRVPMVDDCKVKNLKVGLVELVPPIGQQPSLHLVGVRIARGSGKALLCGRIEIQGVPKFCFLRNSIFG